MIRLCALLMLLCVPQIVRANVDAVTPVPARINVSPLGAAAISVTWQVRRTEPVGATVTVSSASAALQVNGVTVATVGGLLSAQSQLGGGQTAVLTFTETLNFTPAQTRQIAGAAPGTVRIMRLFNDTQAPGTGILGVFAALGGTGPLAVRRIDLSFENASRTDIVRRGDTVRAVADVTYSNNGTLRGEWRIVDAAAALGGGTGRVIQVVRQPLVSSGQGRTRIVSPPLPTKSAGLHLVSFSVQDTTAGFAIPVLQYFVLDGTADEMPPNITALTPGDGATVGPHTVFSWNGPPGAQAYQLMIFEPGGQDAVAAKLVPGTETRLSLTALSLEDLVPGRHYEWQMRAFAAGQVVGASPRRSFIAS